MFVLPREGGRAGYPFLTALFFFLILLVPAPSGAARESHGAYSIRTGAFQNPRNALDEVNRLKKAGLDAFQSRENLTGKREWFVVYAGRYASRMEAEGEARQLRGSGLAADCLIRSPDSQRPDGTALDRQTDPGKVKISKWTRRPGRAEAGPIRENQRVSPPLTVREIVVQPGTELDERVLVRGSTDFSPVVFSLEGKRPRVVMDIENAANLPGDHAGIPVNSALIKRIRAHLHRDTNTLRIVLDLRPSGNYRVTPTFYEQEHLCALEIRASEREGERGESGLPGPEVCGTADQPEDQDKAADGNALAAATMIRKDPAAPAVPATGNDPPTPSPDGPSRDKGPLPASSTDATPGAGAKETPETVEKGRGRNMARGAAALGIRHRVIDVRTSLTKRTALTSDGTEQVNLEGLNRNDFPTTMHTDTLRGRFGLTDYLEMFAELGTAYHEIRNPDMGLLYGGGLRLNLFESNGEGPGRFYGALIGEYLRGDLEYEYRSGNGIHARKETDWREFSAGAEVGLIGPRCTTYLGGTRYFYREDTRREQLDDLPASLGWRVFQDELEEENAYGLFGGILIQLSPKAALNLEGRILDRKSLMGSLEFRF